MASLNNYISETQQENIEELLNNLAEIQSDSEISSEDWQDLAEAVVTYRMGEGTVEDVETAINTIVENSNITPADVIEITSNLEAIQSEFIANHPNFSPGEVLTSVKNDLLTNFNDPTHTPNLLTRVESLTSDSSEVDLLTKGGLVRGVDNFNPSVIEFREALISDLSMALETVEFEESPFEHLSMSVQPDNFSGVGRFQNWVDNVADVINGISAEEISLF